MSIVLEDLTKRYAGNSVVSRVSLEVPSGELFVLLGPSGSGKSTLLRLIAGLTELDAGRILLHGRDVTDQAPAQRGVGFVFQSYALFRTMTVADNVEFALRIRKVPAAERRRRRDELLEMVGLAGLGRRLPRQLSGGQQQRVALARALAHQPQVLLLDEPFGALDARVRLELRRTLREIQRQLGVTTLFVTHDQDEAFELADRVGVMDFGRLLEVGPPEELYLRPETEFVATFLGTANLMVGESAAGEVRLGPVRFPLQSPLRGAGGGGVQRVQVLFRPEDVAVRGSRDELSEVPLGEGVVAQRTFVGSVERLRLTLPALPGVRTIAPAPPFGSDALWVEASRSQDLARRFPLAAGDRAWVGVGRVHALAHRGMKFVLLDGVVAGAASGRALELGRDLARRAHARVAALVAGGPERVQEAREKLGSGLTALEVRAAAELPEALADEVRREPCDLAISAVPEEGALALAVALLAAGAPHLLLLRAGATSAAPALPARALVCVAVGEPGKEDVAFSARLLRHVGAAATIVTVVRAEESEVAEGQAQRFLERSARTFERLGLSVATRVRRGEPRREILAELAAGGHDLLVIGAPLTDGRPTLSGLAGDLLAQAGGTPVLLVQPRERLW